MIEWDKFFNYFAGSGFIISMFLIVMAVIFVFVIMLIYVPALTKIIFPRFGYARYSAYLPFRDVLNNNSMQMADGSFVRVYRVAGVQTSMQDEQTRAKFLDLRTHLFNQINDPFAVLRFYTIRNAADENTDYEFGQPVLQRIYDKWKSQGLKIFLNNFYIVLMKYLI